MCATVSGRAALQSWIDAVAPDNLTALHRLHPRVGVGEGQWRRRVRSRSDPLPLSSAPSTVVGALRVQGVYGDHGAGQVGVGALTEQGRGLGYLVGLGADLAAGQSDAVAVADSAKTRLPSRRRAPRRHFPSTE